MHIKIRYPNTDTFIISFVYFFFWIDCFLFIELFLFITTNSLKLLIYIKVVARFYVKLLSVFFFSYKIMKKKTIIACESN